MALAPTSGISSLLPGYTISEEVYRGRRRIVYRGTRDRDGALMDELVREDAS